MLGTKALIEVIDDSDDEEVAAPKEELAGAVTRQVEGGGEGPEAGGASPVQEKVAEELTEDEKQAGPKMTLKALKKICRDLKLYSTPELNDKLFLHYKGFRSVGEDIGHYFGCKVLYLEGNGLTKIENLEKLTELRCLYLQENCIYELEGLDTLEALDTLNVCSNQLDSLGNLSGLKRLGTVMAAKNRLKTADDVRALLDCPTLSVVDLRDNRIEDPAIVDEVLVRMENLKVLYLKGNPVVNKIKNYRKTLVARIPQLTYLDDRPVFPGERRAAEAWLRGGADAEKAERELIRKEKREKDERNFLAFRRLVAEGKKKMLAAKAEAEVAKSADGCVADDEEEKVEGAAPFEGAAPEAASEQAEVEAEAAPQKDDTFVTQQDAESSSPDADDTATKSAVDAAPVAVEGVAIDMLTDLD